MGAVESVFNCRGNSINKSNALSHKAVKTIVEEIRDNHLNHMKDDIKEIKSDIKDLNLYDNEVRESIVDLKINVEFIKNYICK